MKRSTKIALMVTGGLAALMLTIGLGGRASAEGGEAPTWRQKFMKKFVDARIDTALDHVKAAPDQRRIVQAAKEKVIAVIERDRQGRKAMFDEALQLFEGGEIDQVRLAALQSEHEARSKGIQQAVLAAIKDVHQTLTPLQRKALTQHIRQQRAAFHGGHGAAH